MRGCRMSPRSARNASPRLGEGWAGGVTPFLWRTEATHTLRTSAFLRAGLLLSVVLAACAPQSMSRTPLPAESTVQESAASQPPKILNIVLVGEPRALTTWQESTTGGVVNIHELITT